MVFSLLLLSECSAITFASLPHSKKGHNELRDWLNYKEWMKHDTTLVLLPSVNFGGGYNFFNLVEKKLHKQKEEMAELYRAKYESNNT